MKRSLGRACVNVIVMDEGEGTQRSGEDVGFGVLRV